VRAPQINDLIATGGVAHCDALFLLDTAGDATRLDWRGNRVSDCAADVRLVRRPARPARHQLHYRAPSLARPEPRSVAAGWLAGLPGGGTAWPGLARQCHLNPAPSLQSPAAAALADAPW